MASSEGSQVVEKAAVDLALLDAEEVNRLTKLWGVDASGGFEKLCGGYSSVNYRVNAASDGKAAPAPLLLRVAVNVEEAHARTQVAVLLHYAECGMKGPRLVPALSGEYLLHCVTSSGQKGFATVQRWLGGTTANKLVPFLGEERPLGYLGAALATVHAAPPPSADVRARLCEVGGEEYIRRYIHLPPGIAGQRALDEFMAHMKDESTSEEDAAGIGADRDAFIAMVREFFTTGGDEMTALASAGAGRARLIHGDPFLDNLMVNGAGEAAAAARNFAGLEPEDIAKAAGSGEDESNLDVTLIDFEDTCVGPPVYDLAQAAIGGCFGPAPACELRPKRIRALLSSYSKKRAQIAAQQKKDAKESDGKSQGVEVEGTLTTAEAEAFASMMRWSAVIVMYFRYRTFNFAPETAPNAPPAAKKGWREMYTIALDMAKGGKARAEVEKVAMQVAGQEQC